MSATEDFSKAARRPTQTRTTTLKTELSDDHRHIGLILAGCAVLMVALAAVGASYALFVAWDAPDMQPQTIIQKVEPDSLADAIAPLITESSNHELDAVLDRLDDLSAQIRNQKPTVIVRREITQVAAAPVKAKPAKRAKDKRRRTATSVNVQPAAQPPAPTERKRVVLDYDSATRQIIKLVE